MFGSASPQKAKGPPPPVPRSRQPVRAAPTAKSQITSAPIPETEIVATPVAPIAPPPPPPAPEAPKSSTNPFHRPNLPAAPVASTTTSDAPLSKTNPFNIKNRDQAASPIEKPPTPKPSFIPPPSRPTEDWDMPTEHFSDSSDSSDDDEPSVGARNKRQQLAANLFGGIMPSRPTSAAGNSASPASGTPPPPPAAPRAPIISVPSGPVDRSSLLGQIQGGIGLRKAKTNDRSSSALAGQVLGSAEPPPHIRAAPVPQEASQEPIANTNNTDHRQSVDWYNGLASDSIQPPSQAAKTLPSHDESMEEEPEEEQQSSGGFFSNAMSSVVSGVSSAAVAVGLVSSEVAGVDYSRSTRSRTLYAYSATSDRPDDLSVDEHVILTTHPANDNEDWVYGKIEKDSKSGWLPANYVASIENAINANAIYDYSAASEEEMDLQSGKSYKIVDRSESDWWKAEDNGRCALVPAMYFEVDGSQ